MFGYYSNNNLRKLVVAFGSLFNDIHVGHKNPDGGNDLDIRVPITYASQEKFIQSLNAALVRIENKTYGVCRVTGLLIPKERLRLVPHATMSIDAKNAQKN